MYVKHWMTSNVHTVESGHPIAVVDHIMREHRIRRVPVVDAGQVVGIISRGDLLRAMPSFFATDITVEAFDQAAQTPAGSVMTPSPISVHPNTPLEQAALLMRTHKFGSLLVSHHQELTGIITETNIFDAFLEMLAARKQGARIEIQLDRHPHSIYQMLDLLKLHTMTLMGISVYPDFSATHQLVTLKIGGEELEPFLEALAETEVQVHRVHAEP